MSTNTPTWFAVFSIVFLQLPAFAERELSTDRPDKTESAYTVEYGRYQIEMDIVSYARGGNGDSHENNWRVAPFNLKAGVTNSTDVQFLFEPYVRTDQSNNDASDERVEGVGDINLRLKQNLWGNDSGSSAFALMPFIKAPTNSNDLGNDSFEGGIIAPFAFELGERFGLGLMTEVDILREDDDTGNYVSFINTATVGTDFTDELGVYLEFFSEIPEGDAVNWIGTVDCGFTFALSKDLQLDGGVNVGVTGAAEDIEPFLGISWRI